MSPNPGTTPPFATRLLLSARARRAWQVLLVLLMVATCVLAFDPHPPPAVQTGWDKLDHVLAFITLACCAELGFRTWPHKRLLGATGLLAFGAFIELVQTTIPGRSGEWQDLLADGVGIALGQLAIALLL